MDRHALSGQSQVYLVMQLRIDGVHCPKSAGTGPVDLKVVKRVLAWQVTMDQLICASLSHTHYWYEVGILKVPACICVVVVVVVSHIQRIGCQPEKTTLHGGQSLSWSVEQGKENKRKSLAAYPPPPTPPHTARSGKI